MISCNLTGDHLPLLEMNGKKKEKERSFHRVNLPERIYSVIHKWSSLFFFFLHMVLTILHNHLISSRCFLPGVGVGVGVAVGG